MINWLICFIDGQTIGSNNNNKKKGGKRDYCLIGNKKKNSYFVKLDDEVN